MKKIVLLSTLALVLGFSSCTRTELPPLTGVFPAPTTETFATGAATCEAYKLDGKRYFDLKISGTYPLVATLVGDQYYLTANTYTEATEDEAKKGNYILGETTVAGKNVKSGNITVTQNEDNYTILAVVFTADGAAYKLNWAGKLEFEPDPEPVALSVVLTASSNVDSGTNSVTLSLATPGVSYDAATYSYTGSGNYLAVDLYSADGYLHEGVYTASAAGGVINEGEFGIGWDPGDLWGIGMVFENWGTCWWTVNGTATAKKITSGTISVKQKGNKWIITWGSEDTYPDWAQFEGEIEALTPAGGGGDAYDGVSLTQNFGIIDYVTLYSMKMVGIEMGTSGIVATPGAWGNNYTGNGNYLKLEIYSEDGKIAPGTYTACAVGGEIGPGEFGIGYDGMFGASGTAWYTLENDVATYKYITDGVVTVELDGDDYKISIESSVIKARYGYGEGGGEGGGFEGVSLTEFFNFTDYLALYSMKMVGIEMGTSDIVATPGAWGNTYTGNGNYLKLEIYSEDGKIAAGTYTACAEGGAINSGEFGIGYDGMFGASGTTWYTLENDVATYKYITDGVVTVEVDGDVYTIILESTVVNAKYVGKLSAE